jgi:hypothetical protein
MLVNKALDLKNVWVVFKRIKKQNWYHRGPNYQVCSTRAHQAAKFLKKEEAEAHATKLNAGRKSYRFKVEPASKHFVNNWSLSYQNWTKEVIITSAPIGIDRLAKLDSWEKYRPTLNSQKQSVLDTLQANIDSYNKDVQDEQNNLKDNLERAERDYKRSIEQYHNSHIERVKRLNEQNAKIVGMKTALETTDLDTEYVEKFGTDMDTKAKILFGSKANVNS